MALPYSEQPDINDVFPVQITVIAIMSQQVIALISRHLGNQKAVVKQLVMMTVMDLFRSLNPKVVVVIVFLMLSLLLLLFLLFLLLLLF